MLHPCVENREDFPAFYGNSIRPCLNLRENGFEFRTPEAKCLISSGILSVFARRQFAVSSGVFCRRQLGGKVINK
jgi:hypothetical protein